MELSAGEVILGRYELRRPLGTGATASTWLAEDRLWRTPVALKAIRTASFARTLRNEFSTLLGLAHPSLVRVHDFGFHVQAAAGSLPRPAPLWFYTADFVDGAPLLQAARARRWNHVRPSILHAVEALRVLHCAGVRHGDLKPAHILVQPDGRVVLIDFGCAGALQQAPQAHVSGTRGFMAPELLSGDASDQRADLYALGVSLRQLLDVLAGSPPRALTRLVERMTARQPGDRPASVDEVLEALGAEPASISNASDRLGWLVGRDEELSEARRVLRAIELGSPGPHAMHVRGPRGVGRSRFLRELKWDAQQRMIVVEAHPLAANSLQQGLRTLLDDETVEGDLQSLLSSLRRVPVRSEPALLVVDDLQGFSEPERRIVLGLARSLPADGRLGVAIAECTGKAVEGDGIVSLQLGPLTAAQVHDWLAPRLDDESLALLFERSAGFPLRIIGALGAPQCVAQPTKDRLPGLSQPATQALAALLAMSGTLAASDLAPMGIEPAWLSALHEAGLVARDGALWRLADIQRDIVSRLTGVAMLAAYQRKAAAHLLGLAEHTAATSPAQASRLRARAVLLLATAGDLADALAQASLGESLTGLAPAEWAHALHFLAAASHDDRTAVLASRCEIEAGLLDAGIARLDKVVDSSSDDALRALAMLEAGFGHARAARHDRAMELFRRVLETAPEAGSRARACDGMARSCIRQGRYREGVEWAERGLSLGGGAATDVGLLCSAGIARSYLGALAEAEQLLNDAAARLDDATPAEQLRVLGSRGVNAYRAGRLAQAADYHGRALEIARRRGLHGDVATGALNLGAVLHQQGAFLRAQEVYENGLRVAVALARHGTEAWLHYDLAKLHADLGQFHRAQHTAEHCAQLASRLDDPVTRAAADAMLGEIACLRGDDDTGVQLLTRARDTFAAQESTWEHLELQLQLTEAHLHRGASSEAEACLASARALVERGGEASPDLRVKLAMVEARFALRSGQPARVVAGLEAALAEASALGLRDVQAEIEALLAEAWQAQAAFANSAACRQRARAIWERLSADLAAPLREGFWRHPRRSHATAPTAEPDGRPDTRLESRLRLLLEINKRLNSSLSTEEVLRRAMDAAVELTGAERGFLLLRGEAGSSELRVGVARNVDQEQVARSHMKFSRSIAEWVIESRQPVVTTDAQADDRFRGEESVHAMSLQSVLCVPVESPAGVLGALYLDNRFNRGRFQAQDVDLLQAFADQVAIALLNARVHAELAQRNADLEAERRRVQEMMDAQAVQLDRLQEEVRQTRRTLGRRHDFVEIVGNSPAMQRSLEVLDRVVDASVPVLIEGESGTGKELFARALHTHGARRDKPFVAINCGALPESLLESELFGHERGAFTGADRAREGLVVMCRGGTLFLDEIGEMPPSMQVKLLRVLQEREVRPLGSSRTVPVDFRLVSATNRNLRQEVRKGAFREDLYYRISAVGISVPALRDRTEDIPALAIHLLARACESMGRAQVRLTPAAQRKLAGCAWPGNARQLENVLLRALVMSEGDLIDADAIELPEQDRARAALGGRRAFEQEQVQRIAEVLRAHGWNITKALPQLGIPRATLYRLLKRHGMLQR